MLPAKPAGPATRYRNTQPGNLLVVALGAGLLMVLYILLTQELHWLGVVVALVLALCLYTFSSLTVEVTEEALSLSFRGGLLRRRFPLRDLRSARPVRFPWYYGWGVRLIVGGWLYSVSGRGAVEVRTRRGQRYLIGTNEPERLAQAIRDHLPP